VVLASVACLAAAAFSYLPAMVRKHNVGLGVSSVELLRQHGGSIDSAPTRHHPPRSRKQAREHGFAYPSRNDEDGPSGRPHDIGSIQGKQHGQHQDR
jgi:hypothetical protein